MPNGYVSPEDTRSVHGVGLLANVSLGAQNCETKKCDLQASEASAIISHMNEYC